MSWLRKHVRHFVVPGIRAIARAGDKHITAADVEPRALSLRPAKNCFSVEAGYVYSALSSLLPNSWAQDVTDGNDPWKTVKFTKAQLLEIIRKCDPKVFGAEASVKYDLEPPRGFAWYDSVHTLIKASSRALERLARGRTVIFPGRDAWAWEVMARKHGFVGIYDSRISREVSDHPAALLGIIREWGITDLTDAIIFDSGWNGSVYRNFCAATGIRLNNVMFSTNLTYTDPKSKREMFCQVFPRHKGTRAKCLTIEYFPKYFRVGVVKDGKPEQWLQDIVTFVKAAAFTIWLWHYESPRFLKNAMVRPIHPRTKINMEAVSDLKAMWGNDIADEISQNLGFDVNPMLASGSAVSTFNLTVGGSTSITMNPMTAAQSTITPAPVLWQKVDNLGKPILNNGIPDTYVFYGPPPGTKPTTSGVTL